MQHFIMAPEMYAAGLPSWATQTEQKRLFAVCADKNLSTVT
jgi:hypothetical protein